MAKKTGKKTGKLDLFPIINGIIMVLFIVITLYPVLNTLAISLNDGTDDIRGGQENSHGKTISPFFRRIT